LPQGIGAWQDRANQISQTLQQVGPADVAVLGMGLDGHFASWFARSPDLCAGLDPQQAKACMAVRLIQPPAEAPFDRMSQTLAHLAKSALCVLPIVGEGKLKVWNQACRQAGPQWPVSAWLSMRSTPLLLWVTP
jgi:6-phosphogluconolactonase